MSSKLLLNGQVIAEKVKKATSMLDRMIGLMFAKEMVDFDCLLISPCTSIHTFFMRYNIDVIFCDKNHFVLKVYRNLKPWRITPIFFKSSYVLELKAGTLPDELVKGSKLELQCTS